MKSRSRRGANAISYGLLAAIISVACIAALTLVGTGTSENLKSVERALVGERSSGGVYALPSHLSGYTNPVGPNAWGATWGSGAAVIEMTSETTYVMYSSWGDMLVGEQDESGTYQTTNIGPSDGKYIDYLGF